MTWQVSVVRVYSDYWIFSLFQPPPLIAGFPVLHYVVSYNISDNSIEVQAKLSPSHNSYTVFGVPGVTYYITVFAANALGPGPITERSTVNGEKNNNNCIMSLFIIFSVTAASFNYFNTSLNYCRSTLLYIWLASYTCSSVLCIIMYHRASLSMYIVVSSSQMPLDVVQPMSGTAGSAIIGELQTQQ